MHASAKRARLVRAVPDPDRMKHALEIRLLGPFEVVAGRQPANVSGGKRQGLLALLALRCGRVVDVDFLIEALWAEDLPAAPRNAVQHHVARLRAALGQETIAASPSGYALTDAAVDAHEFEELLQDARSALRAGDAGVAAESVTVALELWRGPALHGLTDTPWFSTEARRLESLRVDALEEQFEAALALGEHREILAALRATLEENPYRERLWGQLMLALYRSGRQPDALEAYQEARRLLSEELALEPGPDLRRLQEAILAHDPAIAPVSVAPRRRGNLPAPATSFVGREEELAQVTELLREHRLVTLTGSPGVGKSRLAVEVARSLEPAAGAWRVDLGSAEEPRDVARLVAAAVDARGADPLARAISRLRDGDAILLLDACERVLGEAARVAQTVLADCPHVRVLATSREVLHLPGEVRFAVGPLALPADDSPDDSPSAAVRLFIDRTRAARPQFELTDEAVAIVADICRLVDGLPLAIELAAARLNALGLGELRLVVERRLALLREPHAADPGSAALGTLVEWSYDLLHEDEKSLLHKVAVHRGGASLPSLVAVSASRGLDEGTVTYLLGVLVEKSIVSVSFPAGDARYDVLDTVREYALERLAEAGRLDAARRSHAEHFATLADAAWPGLRGRDWQTWLHRLELDHDNLWAALTYARDAHDAGVAARLASLGWYFTLAERVAEGRRFVELALAVATDDIAADRRIDALAALCFLATEELDFDAAIEIGERALTLPTIGTNAPQVGFAKATLALAVADAGDIERGARLAEEARALLEGSGDHWAFTVATLLRAHIAAAMGDASTVAAMAADAHRHAEAIGFDAFRVPAILLDAWVAERQDDGDAAADAYRRALDLADSAGFADHVAFALSGLASCALARGDLRHAEELERRALATAKEARADWSAAHARVGLGRILAAAGDTETAARLYRNVLEWSQRPRQHGPRESLFLALAGDPAAAASVGLAALGDGHAVTSAAAAPA
jgi:predicted ATPase/DNA-binding SARP family transcriptional activator